uniref:Uncharacterized protein n=1 Tax=viral metagenome TaxID=1070528 RepID=A0A6C0DMQ1_9ZZZZ
MSSKRSMAPRRKSSMKKLFSKNRKFGGDGDVSAMSTQELSYHGKMDELQAKISSGASNVEGDYFALPPWNAMTNIQAALKGLVADRKKGTVDPTNTARMDIIMYLIENEAKTDYLLNYLKQYPLPKEYLTVWMDRLLETGAHDDLVESLAEIQTSTDSTPSVATKDYKAEMNAIFVTKKNTEPDAAKNMLFSVAKDGSPDNMTKMILNYKQDINAVDVESGKTPLIVAAENGNLGVVKVIFETENIRKNILENKQDNEGNTAFIVACNAQPVNKELVEYLAGNLDEAGILKINNKGKSGYDILLDHKTKIVNKIDPKKSPMYAETTTLAQKDVDKAQLEMFTSLLKTVVAKLPKPTAPTKPAVDKQLLKVALTTYINNNFKDKYLQFIDVEMKEYDPRWKFISSCKKYTFSSCKIPSDFYDIKQNLYSQLVNYYNKTGEWIDFNTVVNVYVLDGINPSDKKAINAAIKEDIEDSGKALEAKKPSLLSGVIKSVVGGSRRSKKRSASKTRKQKK